MHKKLSREQLMTTLVLSSARLAESKAVKAYNHGLFPPVARVGYLPISNCLWATKIK